MNKKIVFALIFGFSLMANAKVRLQPIFSDNMVIATADFSPAVGRGCAE